MITLHERGRERALLLAVVLDVATALMMLSVGAAAGSLTAIAEGLRAALMVLVDWVSLVVLRRIHRGTFAAYQFGTAKLERFCSLLIAAGLVGGTLWVGLSALQLASAGRSDATPLGLAAAAVCGAVNLCVNFIAWDKVRRVLEGRNSVIMRSQLRARWTKLLASLIVQFTMTGAAWAKDPELAAVADAVGALVVCCVMAGAAWSMAADALPSLLDRSANALAGPALRDAARALPPGFALHGFRSRGTAQALWLEVTVGCDPDTDIVAVQWIRDLLAIELAVCLPGTELSVTVLPVPSELSAH
jgi:divalent metal cation (Fe/Co/Zn/Cd) transporter